jgi:drug/metabolite transporter (DMT)-like permease
MALSTVNMQRLLFAILCTVWGTNWLAMKAGVTVVPPGIFSGLRWTAAGAIMIAWRLWHGQRILAAPHVMLRVTWLGFLMISVNAVVMLYGLREITTGLAAVLCAALTSIAMIGFAAMLGQERFRMIQLLALALGLFGIGLLFGPKAYVGELRTAEVIGALAVIAGNLCYCWVSVVARPLLRVMEPTQWVALTNFIGGVILIGGSLAFEPGAWTAMRLDWGWAPWAAMISLIFAGSLGATVIYFYLVRDWGAGRTGTHAFISPVLAVLLGVALLGETVHLLDAVGMLAMLGAAGIALRRG